MLTLHELATATRTRPGIYIHIEWIPGIARVVILNGKIDLHVEGRTPTEQSVLERLSQMRPGDDMPCLIGSTYSTQYDTTCTGKSIMEALTRFEPVSQSHL